MCSSHHSCSSGQKGLDSMRMILKALLINFTTQAEAVETVLTGTVTHVRDGDTIEVNNVPIRLAALDCPERGTRDGDYASMIAKQFQGLQATCEFTGAKTYDRLVGYCEINGADFGRYMMENSACRAWEKYDVWDRY